MAPPTYTHTQLASHTLGRLRTVGQAPHGSGPAVRLCLLAGSSFPHAKPVCTSAPAAPAWHSPWPVTLHINSSSPTCRVSHAESVPPCTNLAVVNGQQASRPCPAPFPRTQLPSWLTQASVHAITINCCCSSLCATLLRGCFPFMAIKGL